VRIAHYLSHPHPGGRALVADNVAQGDDLREPTASQLRPCSSFVPKGSGPYKRALSQLSRLSFHLYPVSFVELVA
jgi:hypothetical protein